MTEVLSLNISGSVTCHAWNGDRTQTALSPNSKEIMIYTRSSGGWKLTQTLTEHSSKVMSIDWAPKSNRIVTCGADKNAYVWSYDGRVWKPELVVLRINRAATCVQWSPNEKKFAVGCGHRCICVCYYEPNQCFWVAKHIKKQIRSTTLCLDWHPNSCLIAAGGSDFKCRIFGAYVAEADGPSPAPTPWAAKVSSNECIGEYSTANHGWVHSCSFNPSGTVLGFVGHDSTVYMVDANRNPKQLLSKRTPFLPFLSFKFLTETSAIAAGHDCFPVVFGLNRGSGEINLIEKIEINSSKEAANKSAMDRFIALDRSRQSEQSSSTVSSIHQNSIKQLAIYKGTAGRTSHVSTCALDGLVVIWDLNALANQFSNLKIN